MNFIPVRKLRLQPAEVWKDLKKDNELIITNNGNPIALMTPVNSENLEETILAFRRSRAFQALSSIHHEAITSGKNKTTQAQIEKEIKAVRKKRK